MLSQNLLQTFESVPKVGNFVQCHYFSDLLIY